MSVRRDIVATMWRGPSIVKVLGPGDPNPTPAELDALAVEWTARNDGVKPVVRVLERAPSAFGRNLGPAGSTPRC